MIDQRDLTDEVSNSREVVGMSLPSPYDTGSSYYQEEAACGFCPYLIEPASPKSRKECKGDNRRMPLAERVLEAVI